MANWNLPTATSGYLDFVTEMNDKFNDAGTLSESPTNQPIGYIRWNRTTNTFQEWTSTGWQDKAIAIAGGGTGSTVAAGARTNLGLGSMATQNSNAVNITGGSISGINLDAGGITSGIIALARGGTGSSLALPPYGWLIVSSGTQMVMDSGISILQLNADRIVAGTVPVARLPANVALTDKYQEWTNSNGFGGYTNFVGPISFRGVAINAPTFTGASPTVNFYDEDSPSGSSLTPIRARITYDAGIMYFQGVDDAYTSANTWGSVRPTGFVGSGVGLINLNGSNINGGFVNTQFIGTGPRDSTTFLRGDNVWAVPPSGGSGGTPIPAGLVAIFDGNCPAGWTRYTALDNRFPLGSGAVGNAGGNTSHSHSLTGNTDNQGGHTHSVDAVISGSGHGNVDRITSGPNAMDSNLEYDSGGSIRTLVLPNHSHNMAFPIDVTVTGSASGNTNTSGAHTHGLSGGTNDVSHMPPWYSVVWCRKD